MAAMAFASLAHAKEIVRYIGPVSSSGSFGTGSFAGEFSTPRDPAVNGSGNGPAEAGDVYIADDNNHRIQRFDSDGDFVSAWGKDVIAASVNERQRLLVDAAGGSYQLTFNGVTTAPIAFDAGASAVDDALDVLSSIGGNANVTVSGSGTFLSPFFVTFTGLLAGANQPQMTIDTGQLQGTASVATIADGTSTTSDTGSGYEVCTVPAECKAGAAPSGANGALDNPHSVAVDEDTGNVYVSDRDNRRINVYDGVGNFIHSWGWDVVTGGATGTGTVTDGSTSVTSVSTTGQAFAVGQTITGDGIPAGTTITAVGATTLTLSQPAGAPCAPTCVAPLTVAAGAGNVAVDEEQTITVSPGAVSGNFKLRFTAPNPQSVTNPQTTANIPFNATVAQLQAELDALTNIGVGNVTVSLNPGGDPGGDPAAGGPWTVTFDGARFSDTNVGTLVRVNGSPNLNTSSGFSIETIQEGSAGFETCTDSGCKTGVAGDGVGQIGSAPTFGASLGLAVSQPDGSDATGTVFLADTNNRRVNTYDVDGANPASFGSSAEFGSNQPRAIAVDSHGIVYASDSSNSNEIDRYDSLGANGPVGFLASIAVPPLLAGDANFPGLAVDPDSDGGGSEEDVLYVLRGPGTSAGVHNVQQFGPDNDPGLAAAPIDFDALHGSATFFPGGGGGVSGLAFDEPTGRLFMASAEGLPATGEADRVYVLSDPLPDPGMVLNPVTAKTDTTATFSASVDPTGGLISCAFQYSTDPGFATSTDIPAPDCDAFDPDGGYQTLSAKVTGLDSNTHYFVRLRVTRTFDASAVAISEPIQFNTDSVPPVVTDTGAIQVTDSSARLVATIDPKNSTTGYVFQYGTTPALGSSTAPVNIGSGTDPITISQVVGGLSKDTDYFFRLVASNEFGSTNGAIKTFHTRAVAPPPPPPNCPNQPVREEQSTNYLPDCRAYEMVSPVDKNLGSVADRVEMRAAFARDGDGVAFCTVSLFGEPPPPRTLNCGGYLSRRSKHGWDFRSQLPPFCFIDYDSGGGGEFDVYVPNVSYDRIAFGIPEFDSCSIPRLDPNASSGVNIYRGDFTADPFSFDLLTPAPNVGSDSRIAAYVTGGSDDFSHVVYISRGLQTLDASAPGVWKLFDWEEEGQGDCSQLGGCLSLVSVDTSDAPFTTHTKVPVYSTGGGTSEPIASAVSGDGERIYFQNEGGDTEDVGAGCVDSACDLYLREGNETTLHVSVSECTLGAACGGDTSPARFKWADPTGAIALFTSCSRLTDASAEARSCDADEIETTGDGYKLYRWDRGAPEGSRLVDLTADHESTDGSQPRALDLIGASEDGEVVYFVASGQIVSGAPTGPGLKIYRWRWSGGSPEVDYLAPYLSSRVSGRDLDDSNSGVEGDPNANRRHVRVTPDGGVLLIRTKLAYDPAADRDSDADLYRWDEDGGWLCISCQLPGAPSAGHVDSLEPHLPYDNLNNDLVSLEPEHSISDDGRRVFFTTPDALVPQDVNGEEGCPILSETISNQPGYACTDVYEWHDGKLSLLTSGTGSGPVILIGATKTGRDVFFATPQRLIGWDVDNAADIYDVRRNGGFAEPPPVSPECEGEGCRGAGTVVPSGSGVGTDDFESPRGSPSPFAACHTAARSAKRLSNRARRGRRNARRLAANGKRGRARGLHRRAGRLSKRAKRRSNGAKRCRRAVRRAGR